MGKRPNLAANVKAAALDAPIMPAAQIVQAVPEVAAAPPESKRNASRAGRKAVYAWVDPAEHRKLKRLSFETGRSIDALVTEAVHLLFDKHGVV